jgi:hypothetical protein
MAHIRENWGNPFEMRNVAEMELTVGLFGPEGKTGRIDPTLNKN